MMMDTGPLVSYREEGGIGGARPALVVSRRAVAGLRLGRCHTAYRLGPRR